MTDQNTEKHVHAYDRMLENVKEFMGQSEKGVLPKLQHGLEYARDKAVELGELTLEEADKISDYLKRDVEDAANYLGEQGDELKDWLRLDILMVENKLLELFSQVVDHTRLDLDRLAMEANAAGWRTGEITGIGVLECSECGEKLHFHKSGRIPPCPKCSHTAFQRISE